MCKFVSLKVKVSSHVGIVGKKAIRLADDRVVIRRFYFIGRARLDRIQFAAGAQRVAGTQAFPDRIQSLVQIAFIGIA